ncbi:hypothetical protein [Pontixanthobacter aquaemixtae]|uniref:DUF4129 domain-containing protein n=1 Tax=Pontixanthobacter aquaemixtae TaxID=1958940 RepID=A0A844ZWI1_9SPHN|nr:hypothetical protein [Pontixanthobacter aquaemixtae]MXO91804.1 hypothetical protein [Pontixanthobacter aquaemixtae]
MTTAPVQIETDAGGAPANGWESVRADDSIQYAPIEIPERDPPSPNWLDDVFRWLGEIFEPVGGMFGASWPVVKWVLIALAVLMVLYLLWKLLAPVLDLAAKDGSQEEDDWVPPEEEALALLEDADRLAAEGRYDEATHLLLKRSVSQISSVRPGWVEPSSTARELASLPALPAPARAAFSTIADRVERSLFALKKLGADDWKAARSAYADFALQRLVEEI